MKKLLVILTCLFSIGISAQIQYPRYEKDSLGQTVVVMTIEQAQALDNNTDLLELFRKLDAQIVDYDSVCVKVISEKDKVINEQTVQISKLKETLEIKNSEVSNLQQRLSENNKKISSFEEEIKNKDKEIQLHKKEVIRVKRNMWIGGSLGGISIVGLVLAILTIK